MAVISYLGWLTYKTPTTDTFYIIIYIRGIRCLCFSQVCNAICKPIGTYIYSICVFLTDLPFQLHAFRRRGTPGEPDIEQLEREDAKRRV